MKVIVPFLLLTGIVWHFGLQSPEEDNPAISYAGNDFIHPTPEVKSVGKLPLASSVYQKLPDKE